jgi:hypothetical protein
MPETTSNLTNRIDAYSLVELLEAVQENILKGYLIDTSTNENYPQIIGHHYTLGMTFGQTVPLGVIESTPKNPDEEQEVVEVKNKPGRKSKEV